MVSVGQVRLVYESRFDFPLSRVVLPLYSPTLIALYFTTQPYSLDGCEDALISPSRQRTRDRGEVRSLWMDLMQLSTSVKYDTTPRNLVRDMKDRNVPRLAVGLWKLANKASEDLQLNARF